MNIRPTVILGLGKTGVSCANFLASQGESFIVCDQSEAPSALTEFKTSFPDVSIHLGEFKSDILLSAQRLIVSPGISLKHPLIQQAIAKDIEVIGDIELFARHAISPVIAITGSNAKSTVTSLVGYLLESIGLTAKVGGNLGTPALDLLNGSSSDYYVLELSSFQLEETYSLAPLVATVLNISADHMDRYETLQDYIAAKQRVYLNSQYQVINRQDPYTSPLPRAGEGQGVRVFQTPHTLSFGTNIPQDNEFGLTDYNNETFLCFGKEKLISTKELLIKGQHNYANALAALAICHLLKIDVKKLLPALKRFPGLSHRCEFVAEKNAISWYNDSKGTNVGATIAALDGLGATISGKLIWIAGGIGKNADFSELQPSVKKYVRQGILIGQDAPLIQAALQSETKMVQVENLESAVALAKQVAVAGDVVILSPACASFDMFKNFEHRGDVFKALVQEQFK